jgi:hypothetical protein
MFGRVMERRFEDFGEESASHWLASSNCLPEGQYG